MPPMTANTQAELTDCQTKAMDILLREGNVFLTGAAGTGKSFLLSQYLQDKGSAEFPVVASTGAAAVIIGGRTFNSFFGIGILEGGINAAVTRAIRSRRVLTRLQRAFCVIIDEISMLSGTTLLAAERVARLARGRDEPWGGLRIIAVGDFAQLPPVTHGNMEKDWAFRHDIWHASDFQPALLSTVMRTQDIEFLDVLNAIRSGTVNDTVREFLNDHTVESSDYSEGTRLFPRRASADEFNHRKLDALPTRQYEIPTVYEGEERSIENARKILPIPDILMLKEGALVMMRKNDTNYPMRYVNGSLGIVRRISAEELSISLMNGDFIEVGKDKFTILDGDGHEVAGAWNFPVSLAWATTIHKAQGASLDKLIVDLHALWEPGQAYVALSRVRSGSGLSIERWSEPSIRAEPLVTQFYDNLAEAAEKYIPRPLFTFTRRQEPEENRGEEEPTRKKSKSREVKNQVILDLIRKQTSLYDISVECGIKVDRVLLYIEKMLLEGTQLELEYLMEGLEDGERARSCFEEHGIERLRPVFDALGEEVPYLTLRTVRCVMAAEG